MLYLNGMEFERIAKWIGHAHPSVTSNVYGRLSQLDVQLEGVPFAAGGTEGAESRAAWQRVARFVHAPFLFDDAEWEGLRRPPVSSTQHAQPAATVDRDGLMAALRRAVDDALTSL